MAKRPTSDHLVLMLNPANETTIRQFAEMQHQRRLADFPGEYVASDWGYSKSDESVPVQNRRVWTKIDPLYPAPITLPNGAVLEKDTGRYLSRAEGVPQRPSIVMRVIKHPATWATAAAAAAGAATYFLV